MNLNHLLKNDLFAKVKIYLPKLEKWKINLNVCIVKYLSKTIITVIYVKIKITWVVIKILPVKTIQIKPWK